MMAVNSKHETIFFLYWWEKILWKNCFVEPIVMHKSCLRRQKARGILQTSITQKQFYISKTFPQDAPAQYDGRNSVLHDENPLSETGDTGEHFCSLRYHKHRDKKKPAFFFIWKKKPLSSKALGGTQPFSKSLYIKEFHIPNKPSCLSCEWNKLEYISTSHCMENTHPLVISFTFWSCYFGAQKGWRYCQGCCQLPELQGLCLETWAAQEQSSCLWIQGTILKLNHFQVLMVIIKMKRSEFFKENKSRIWSYWAWFRISTALLSGRVEPHVDVK